MKGGWSYAIPTFFIEKKLRDYCLAHIFFDAVVMELLWNISPSFSI